MKIMPLHVHVTLICRSFISFLFSIYVASTSFSLRYFYTFLARSMLYLSIASWPFSTFKVSFHQCPNFSYLIIHRSIIINFIEMDNALSSSVNKKFVDRKYFILPRLSSFTWMSNICSSLVVLVNKICILVPANSTNCSSNGMYPNEARLTSRQNLFSGYTFSSVPLQPDTF